MVFLKKSNDSSSQTGTILIRVPIPSDSQALESVYLSWVIGSLGQFGHSRGSDGRIGIVDVLTANITVVLNSRELYT